MLTCRPDGGDVRVVQPAGGGASHQALRWSPGGLRLAWTRAERRQGAIRATLRTADPDGGNQLVAPLPAPAFFAAWRPDGQGLACLAAGPVGLDLLLVAPGGRPQVALQGAPLFLDWEPGGTRLACHVGDDRLLVLGSGFDAPPRRPVELGRAGGSSAPAWVSDGVVADVDGPDGRRLLAVLDPASGLVRRPLARHDGWARVAASPDGRRLASCVGPLDRGRPRSVLAADDEAIPEALCVVDLVTGEVDVVVADPPVAFEWSPDGRALLVLLPVPQDADDDRPLLRWSVWDGRLGARPLGGPFTPTSWWARTELAFPEQHARARRLWSPDGRAACWAQHRADGRDVVVVHHLDQDEPVEIGPGLAATWSP